MARSGQNLYRTSDLYFSAFLRTAGCVQIKTQRDEGRVYFYFEKTEMIPKLKEDYYNNTAKVSPLDFANNIRSQKSILHSE